MKRDVGNVLKEGGGGLTLKEGRVWGPTLGKMCQ